MTKAITKKIRSVKKDLKLFWTNTQQTKDKEQKKLQNEIWKFWYYIKKLFELRIFRLAVIFIGLTIIIPIPLFFALKPVPSNTITYGATFSTKYADEMGIDWKDAYIKVLDDLGVRHLRLVAYWDEIEANMDTYDYSKIRWQLEEADKRNAKVILSIGRKVPRYPECFEPKWWLDIEDERVRELELNEYLKKTVTELKNHQSIEIWQVENEPYWPFGICKYPFKTPDLKNEIALVRSLDDRPILVQDSGEGGYWYSTYKLGDYLGISMYRKIWYDFWGALMKKFVYFQYPLAHWSYKIKADVLRVPYNRVIVTELQAEPWGPGSNSILSQTEKDQTMSKQDFIETLSYAQKAGFNKLYFWGVEWWLWEKEKNNNGFYWDTAKAIIRNN